MSLKLNVGVSRKIGLPSYSSLGATCAVEVELDNSLFQRDPDSFQEQVRRAYALCDAAVQEHLQRHSPIAATAAPAREPDYGGEPVGDESALECNGSSSRASLRQLQFVRQLATRVEGLGLRRLEGLCRSMFTRPIAEISRADASALIDVLKQLSAGQVDLATVLSGAAP